MGESASILSDHGEPDVERMRKRCFALLSEAGLDSRSDRHDLATFVLGRKVRSWTEFDAAEWRRMTDSLAGWFAVQTIRKQKGLTP